MKIVSTVARYLLGLMFTVIGLNGFLHLSPSRHHRTQWQSSSLLPSAHRILPRPSSRCRCLVGFCCSLVFSYHLR